MVNIIIIIIFFVGKVVRYNTALARFRDNPEWQWDENKTYLSYHVIILSLNLLIHRCSSYGFLHGSLKL